MSPYAYGADNPLAYLDPSGLVAEMIQAARTSWLGTTASISLSFILGWGDAKDIVEALTGADVVTGQQLTGLDRGIAIAAAFLPFIGGAALRKVISEIGRGTKQGLELVAQGIGKVIPGKEAASGAKDRRPPSRDSKP
ncbi:MAG: pre-toxin TG domain-containing protein, partial [Bacillota bacterium]